MVCQLLQPYGGLVSTQLYRHTTAMFRLRLSAACDRPVHSGNAKAQSRRPASRVWFAFLLFALALAGCASQKADPSSPPSPAVLQSIAVTPNPAPSIAAGLPEQFTATGHYSDGSTPNITGTVTWNSSNPAFATISSAGLANGVAAGTTSITAALSGVTSPGISLTVTSAVLQSIAVTPNPAPSIAAGLSEQFTATGHYSDGSTPNITGTVTWNSSNSAFATISPTGLASGVAAGSTSITAGLSGVTPPGVSLTVTAAVLQSIAVTPNPAPSIAAGLSEQFTATGHYSDGSTPNITSTVTWNSSNPAFATISPAGLANGVAAGSTSITAGLSGVTSPGVSLTVTAAVLQSIAVTPNPAPSIAAGLPEQFSATGHYSDGSTPNITSTVAWNSSNPAFATISPAGLASGVAAGTTSITAGLSGVTSPGVSLTVTAAVLQSAYPLQASATGRHQLDQKTVPFLVLGDSPQALIGDLSEADAATYLAASQSHGFNAIWVNLLCTTYTGCNANGTTFDGIAPFTSGTSPSSYDISTPNSAYFQRADAMINLAAQYGLTVFLDPIDVGGWVTTLEHNGATKAYNYGQFLGNRYASFPNIVWLSGNDFQTWSTSGNDNNLVYQVMAGIASTDHNHLQTIELNYLRSYSNQDTAVSSVLTLDAAYTYYETYDEVLAAYNSSPTLPAFLVEANSEYENNTDDFSGVAGAFILREQEYWTMTSGAGGQFYGNHYTSFFRSGWQSYLNTPGTLELAYVTRLFSSIPWWNLVPDQSHKIVTAGHGTYNGNDEDLPLANYVTTAWVPDGSLAVIYDPAGNALTVNMANFSQAVTAAWYDPSNGTFTTIPGSPFANSGSQQFTPHGANNDRDPDWVLVLDVNPLK